jgi:SAM-dependent methyltransferase
MLHIVYPQKQGRMIEIPPSQTFYETIARYYDAENEDMTQDLELYSTLAASVGAPVLDVGCGTGRILLHLAGEGHEVAGIDFSEQMLERARRKESHRTDLEGLVTLYQGDALSYALPRRYNLIIVPYNGLMHFRTTDIQVSLLSRLRQHVLPGGKLVIDLPNAGEIFSTLDDGAVRLERTFYEVESGNLVMQQSVSQLDRAEQLQYVTWIYDEIDQDGIVKRTVAPLTLRYVFPGELDLMLRISGWQRTERFGNYDRTPFEDGCERLIVVANPLE